MLCPQGRNNQKNIPRRAGEITRRAGVPTSPEGESPCPQGSKNQRIIPRWEGKTARSAALKTNKKRSKPLGLLPA